VLSFVKAPELILTGARSPLQTPPLNAERMEKATRGLETWAAAVVTISSRGPISARLRSALDDAHPERLTPKDFSVTSIREQLTQHIVAQRRRAIEVALELVRQVDDSLGRVTKGAEVRISHAPSV